MKIRKGFSLMQAGTQNIAVAVDEAADVFNGMIRLNETGVFLWNLLENGATKEELVSAMTEAYAVDEKTASENIDEFTAVLKKNGILE